MTQPKKTLSKCEKKKKKNLLVFLNSCEELLEDCSLKHCRRYRGGGGGGGVSGKSYIN